MKIEPGVDGRVLEVYEGDALELGRITVWEPGARLAYRSSVDDTEVDVRFESVEGGTRVRVTQTLVPGGEKMFDFWPRTLRWFGSWFGDGRAKEIAPLSIALYYEQPVEAARWLERVFQLRSWSGILETEEGTWIELHHGNVAILLFQLEGERDGASRTCRGCTSTTSTPTSPTRRRRERRSSRTSTSRATGPMRPRTWKGAAGRSLRRGRRCARQSPSRSSGRADEASGVRHRAAVVVVVRDPSDLLDRLGCYDLEPAVLADRPSYALIFPSC